MGNDQDWGRNGPLRGTLQDAGAAPAESITDSLEAGIAAVFEAIRNGTTDPQDDAAIVDDNGATFALLSELNRLWERPAA